MSRIVLDLLAFTLIVYFASGAWAAARRRRALTARDYEKAEQWRTECLAKAPDEDALLRSLDLALLECHETPTGEDAEILLPSEEQKG